MATQRIGLFGGSFDPVHLGHVMVARAALEELRLDRLYIVPAAQSPFKPGQQPAAADARMQLLRLAFDGQTNCEIDTQEIERDGVSYTIDTARAYADRYSGAELFYLIGADHVPTLPEWREAEALAPLVTFVVVPRPGEPVADFPEPFRGRVLHGQPMEISASDIRERLRNGKKIDHLTLPRVAEALKTMHLY
ncbi:MAG: nicotinate (nicotinamide) nucleotide adenylyltransferase [Verrucomicrobiota bacterium]|jgi:nicotinate-nucleotide adenylyltransferase|nr:nicotinate (nicotinamide) nucleotide adenylyltransferase [Verrucomicrobiota bacterium]